jgi:hypothetical protein
MTIYADHTCQGCQTVVAAGQAHCTCGLPTPYASFQDRAAYEVAQWRVHQEKVAAKA